MKSDITTRAAAFTEKTMRGTTFICRALAPCRAARFIERVTADHCNGNRHIPGCTKAEAGERVRSVFQSVRSHDLKGEASGEHHKLMKVSDKTVKRVLQMGGPDISGYIHTISEMDMQHAMNSHPDLTDEDFMRLPEITEDWDDILYTTGKKGKRIEYKKQYGNKKYTVVERIGRKPRTHSALLMFTTQYINK